MKSERIEKLLNKISSDVNIFANNRKTAKKSNLCVLCENPNLNFRDECSKKEYKISRLCQTCQDAMFE